MEPQHGCSSAQHVLMHCSKRALRIRLAPGEEAAGARASEAKPPVASGVRALVSPGLSPGAAGEVKAVIRADGLGEEEVRGQVEGPGGESWSCVVVLGVCGGCLTLSRCDRRLWHL